MRQEASSSRKGVVEAGMVVAEPQHHGDWVVLLGRFQMAMGLMCLWRESQHVVSSDSHPLAERRSKFFCSELVLRFYHLSCAWIVREKWWIIPGSIVVARSQWLNWRRRWICHLLEILRRFKLNDLQKLGLIFSNFPPRHRLLFFFFTSWRKEQLVHKLESRQENL